MMSAEVFGHSLYPPVIADDNDHVMSVMRCLSAKEHEDILRSMVIQFMGYVQIFKIYVYPQMSFLNKIKLIIDTFTVFNNEWILAKQNERLSKY